MGRFQMEDTLGKPQTDLVSYDEDKRPSDSESVISNTVRGDYDAGRDAITHKYRQNRDESRAVAQMLAAPANAPSTAHYLVYGQGQIQPALDRIRAERLARGLAKTNPGHTYMVLEAIQAFRVPAPEVEDVSIADAVAAIGPAVG
jgi:hypothetical protein